MKKYIDADKLKKKVDSFMDNLWKVLPDCSNVEAGELSVREASDLGAYKALEIVSDYIDSLQQEQPVEDLEHIENDAELIANKIMIGVQSNRYHTCVYNTERNDFNHSHLMQAARKGIEKGIELGLNARKEE